MTELEIENLLKKYHEGRCTPEEELLLYRLYDELDKENTGFRLSTDLEEVKQRTLERLRGRLENKRTGSKRKLWYWSAAAAVLILLGLAAIRYMIPSGPAPVEDIYAFNKAHDRMPGSNKAVLTLADGRQILLDDADAGPIARQGGVMVQKEANGQLVYTTMGDPGLRRDDEERQDDGKRWDDGNRSNAKGTGYNTISTPYGGQYEVILPDGSHVWLNAASSLRYPVAFNGNERLVELKGEGYFEITKNPDKPFRVTSKKQTIEVLGTHFNVASYDDEPIVTTLVEGKVKLTRRADNTARRTDNTTRHPEFISGSRSGGDSGLRRNDEGDQNDEGNQNDEKGGNDAIVLKPSQQATLSPPARNAEGRAGKFIVSKVNVDGYIAWKDGLFIFDNTSIKDVLRQISRWYDIEVDYNSLPEKRFNGEISRDFPLSELLKAIEKTNHIKLKIEGRKITIVQ